MEDSKEVQPEVKEEITPEVPEVKEERPEINWQAEAQRKTRELERARIELASRSVEPVKRDPNDIKTWSDHELKAIINSNDPSVLPYKDQANEVLLDRRVDARLLKQQETEKRVHADLELRSKYPEALDPASEMSMKMDEIIREYDLSKTPAGRLAAAKLAAAELNQGKQTSDAKGRKAEQNRVASVKSQMVDGDRPKSTPDTKNLDEKRKELADKLMDTKNEGKQVDAISQILHDRGFSQDKFFGRK